MSLISFISIGSLLFILFNSEVTAIACPSQFNYVVIGLGCYKINNGTNQTWSAARDHCLNEKSIIGNNGTVPNAIIHLIALEVLTEKTALNYWMKAYDMKIAFWVDGVVSTSTWEWSNQSINWYFNADERGPMGNGSHFKYAYSVENGTYKISDDVDTKELNYICEYQVPCTANNSCQHDAECYSNYGHDVCICTPGYTGEYCEIDIDECLSSPCLHGGTCIDGINNYTCNCSIYYQGDNCTNTTSDPTKYDRSAAFWSVVGVVTGLVVLLTLSDLPWEDILSAIGCSCHRLNCCSKKNNTEDINETDLRLSDSPTNDQNYGTRKISITGAPTPIKSTNYHIMNTVWDPEYINNQTPRNPQYNGYRSPDYSKSFTPANISMAQHKQLDDKRIYAVNINEPKSKTNNPADTMVSWTQQLQEQLRNKKGRETSAGSTKQLIHSTSSNDY